MKTKKSDAKKESKKATTAGTSYYANLKETANEHEREGRWPEAAQAWTDIANASTNPMVIKMARNRADAAMATAKDNGQHLVDDTQATRHVVAGRDGEPVEVVIPGREEDAPTAGTDAPVDAAPVNPPPAEDAPTIEPAQPEAPKTRDARLPEVGTVIQKRGRKGELRAECKIVEGGIEYSGATYKSLSSAALAAAKDLGLSASTLDGWAWWGLKTPAATAGATKRDVVASLERAFAKYQERAAEVAKAATGEDVAKVLGAIRSQGAALLAMAPTGN